MRLPRFRIRSLMIAIAIAAILLADPDATIGFIALSLALGLLAAPFLWIGYRYTQAFHDSDRSLTWQERLAFSITLFFLLGPIAILEMFVLVAVFVDYLYSL